MVRFIFHFTAIYFWISAVIKCIQGISAIKGITSFVLKSVQFGKVQGDTAFERGEFTFRDKDDKLVDNGK